MSSDAELVAGVLAGDRDAFAAVYDRYADRLYDFCHAVLRDRHEAQDAVQDTFVLAAQRLSQLKDPDRLRPWLYAVARSVALRRTRARKRIVLDTEVSDVVDPDAGPQRAAEVAALRALVWSAAAGLSERDRALLDLHLRQGLDGAELGEAMGVSTSHAYVLLTRLRDQVERSLGALLIARRGRDDCPDLRELLSNWDGRFSPLLRKRVARHVDNCQVCGERRRSMVSPLALLAAVPLVTAPLALRDQVLEKVELVSHERPLKPTKPGRLPMIAAAVTLLIALGLATIWDRSNNIPGSPLAQDVIPSGTGPAGSSSTPPSVQPPPVGSASAAPTTTTNQGNPPLPPTTTPAGPPTTTTTTTTDPPPQDTARPEIVRQSARYQEMYNDRRCKPIANPVTVVVVDNVGVVSVTVHWIGPDGRSGSEHMTLEGGAWHTVLDGFALGSVQWYVTATDAAGNTGRGPTDKFSVVTCRAV